MNGNIFFILGCPCSGKTTAARLLAQKHDMLYFSGDGRRFDYYRRADRSKHKYMTADASGFWGWTLEEMVAWERGVISEQTPMILEDLGKLSEDHALVLFEGMLDIGYLLKKADRDRIVYLTTDRDTCDRDFFGRGDHNGMHTAVLNTQGISEEEKKRRIEIRKAAAITAFYEDPRALGIQSFSRSVLRSPAEMAEQIERYFGL